MDADAGRRRTLIVAPQWIGDAVMSEPLVAALGEQSSTVAVAALPWVAPVYRAVAAVGETIELPFAHRRIDLARRWQVARTLRGRFDRAYVLPNSFKSALLPWLAGIQERIGYRGEARDPLLTRCLPNRAGRPPMVAHYLGLARAAPGEEDALGTAAPDIRPRLVVADERRLAATASASVEVRNFYAFAPGAEYGPAKRWPASQFAALARRLSERDGLPVVLLGSASEAPLCEEIANASGLSAERCRVLAGRTSLDDAIALIAAARGLASNDSGLMHIAAALDVPQVAVFGSTSPLHTPPLNPHARVVWLKDELGLACMPCFDRTCRYGHYRCLTSVTVATVEAALDAASNAAR